MRNRGTFTNGKAPELLDLTRKLGQGIEQNFTHHYQAANRCGVVTVTGKEIMATERDPALVQQITAEFMVAAGDPITQARTDRYAAGSLRRHTEIGAVNGILANQVAGVRWARFRSWRINCRPCACPRRSLEQRPMGQNLCELLVRVHYNTW